MEEASKRGRFALVAALTVYGGLQLSGGWLAEGERFLAVAEEMTRGWRRNAVRLAVVVGLVRSRALRGRMEPDDPLLAELEAASAAGGATDRARWLEARAMLLQGQGKNEEAVVLHREALLAARRAGRKDFRAVLANNLAAALVEAGDLDNAQEAIQEAEALVGSASFYWAYFWGTRADLALAQGNLRAARAALDQSRQLKESSGATGGIGWTRATQARLAVAGGDEATARSLLDQAAPVLQDLAALRAWENAAAVALPGSHAAVCEAPADPMVDRARSAARPLSKAVGDLEQNLQWAFAIGFGVAAIWLTRDVPVPPGGFFLVNVTLLAVVLAVGYRYLRSRMSRR